MTPHGVASDGRAAPRGPTPAPAGLRPGARIGPNAVTQTLAALAELESEPLAARLAEAAAVPRALKPGLVPEAWFVALVAGVRGALPAPRADAVLRRAGERTAAYVAAHRVPVAARWLLARLPSRVGLPLLLEAVSRHAWTFAGAGAFTAETRSLALVRCPTCRAEAGARARRSGAYYEAAFEGLLRLAAPGLVVRETECAALGADACRFDLLLADREGPCASS